MFVGGIVVQDHVHDPPGGNGGLDRVQKADELLMAMALHAAAQNRPLQHIERRKQGRRAVALIVVGPRRGTAWLQRQPGLGAVEGLDLGFLVHREHDRMGGRIDIEPNHVLEPLGKLRVARELEGADPVWLQAVRGPDALHRAQADARRFGHHPPGPVRGLAGRFGQGQVQHAPDRLVG